METKNKLCAVHEAVRIIAFLCIALLLFLSFCALFCFKYNDGIYGLRKFYDQEEDSVDVLIIGSSHAFENINTAVLYDDFGIASFNLGSSMQPLWNSYHYLVEALKTQSPDLIVLEGYSLASFAHEGDYQDESRIVKNTFGFKPSLNAIENMRVSIPNGEFWEYFFRFYRYHNRYDVDLGAADFHANQGMAIYNDWKGYLPNWHHVSYDTPDAIGLTGTQPLMPKTEAYYRKFIELCQNRGIPLHIVVTPFYFTAQEQQQFNRAAEIAAEYGVPFINYNAPEILQQLDFDFARDMSLANHLMPEANMRFTHLLGENLSAVYDLPDRRGDARYASWARSSVFYARDMENHQLLSIDQLEPYLTRITSDENYTVVLSITGYCADYFDQITQWLAPLGIDDIYFDYAMNGTWVSRGGSVIKRDQPGSAHPFVELDENTVTFDPGYYPIADRTPVHLTEKGLNIVVYDHITQSFADKVGFSALDSFTAVR